MNAQQYAARVAAHYRDDPLGYVENIFPWGKRDTKLERFKGPRNWQAEILDDFGKRLRSRDVEALRVAGEGIEAIKYAIVSGHGSGKSAFLSWITLFIFDTRPYSIGSMTSNTKQQMKGRYFSELQNWLSLSKLSQFGDIVTGESPRLQRVGAENTWKMEGYAPRKELSEGFAGQHAVNSASYYIFDEASAVDDAFYRVAMGGMMDSEPFMFACGNGTRPQGFFYLAHHPTWETRQDPSAGWITRSVNSLDVEGVNTKEIEKILDEHGRDSDTARIRVYGQFPMQGEEQFFSSSLIEQSMGMKKPRDNNYAPYLMGVDVARGGRDKSVVCVRKGRNARDAAGEDTWQSWDKNSLPQLCQSIAHTCSKLALQGTPVQAVFIDGVGVGEGVVDELNRYGLPNIVEVKTGSTKTVKQGAYNKRAEMYMNLREAMREGLALPDGDRLRSDLNNIQYGFRDDGTIKLDSKKEMKSQGKNSPDFSDALALTFCDGIFMMDTPYGLDYTREEMRVQNRGHADDRPDFTEWAAKRGV